MTSTTASQSRLLLLVATLMTLIGCEGFKPDRVVRHPDAPMLVTETNGEWLRVSAYDPMENELVEAGWVKNEETVGWTLSKYNWTDFLSRGSE